MARPTDETGIAPPPRRPPRRGPGSTIQTRPGIRPGQQPRANTANQTRTGSPGGPGSPGTGGAPANPYAAAQAHADRQEQQARSRASKKWLGQAQTMQQQINALKVALGNKGYRKALRIQLRGVRGDLFDTDALLMKGYRERLGSLRNQAEDNEKEGAGRSNAALNNRSRERANAMSEAALQGAGESDTLRAQGASLRNWQANQSEVTRAYHDTLTSVNSALTDLTVDTRTGRAQAYRDANTARNTLWTDYYGNRSEVYTALGNAYGQQAEYYGLANEAIPSKKVKQKQRIAARRYGGAVRQSSLTTGKAWENPGIPKRIKNWEGANPFESAMNQEVRFNEQTEIAPKRPEGASLREWAK